MSLQYVPSWEPTFKEYGQADGECDDEFVRAKEGSPCARTLDKSLNSVVFQNYFQRSRTY